MPATSQNQIPGQLVNGSCGHIIGFHTIDEVLAMADIDRIEFTCDAQKVAELSETEIDHDASENKNKIVAPGTPDWLVEARMTRKAKRSTSRKRKQPSSRDQRRTKQKTALRQLALRIENLEFEGRLRKDKERRVAMDHHNFAVNQIFLLVDFGKGLKVFCLPLAWEGRNPQNWAISVRVQVIDYFDYCDCFVACRIGD
jgi:hypothetical protein